MHVQMVGTGSILSDRISACALVEGRLLIDTPNGAMKALRRMGVDPTSVDGCLITHFHADHFFDIVFLLLEAGLRQQRESPLLLVGPSGLADRVKTLFKLSYPDSWDRVRSNAKVRFHELDGSEESLAVAGFQVRAVPVKHTTPSAYGFLISDGTTTIGVTGDSEFCPGVETIVRESSTAIVDVSFSEGRSGHMGASDARHLAQMYPDTTLIATHMTESVRSKSWPFLTLLDDGDEFDA